MTSDVNGTYRGVYTYGLERISESDQVAVEGVPNDPLFYLYDGRGSVTQLTNTANTVKDKYRYTPFGVPMPGGELSPNTRLFNNPYGYNGEDYDIESGLQFLRARYYNSDTARFVSRDSYLGDVMEPLSLNRYAYTSNNPLKYADPSGHVQRVQGYSIEDNKQQYEVDKVYYKEKSTTKPSPKPTTIKNKDTSSSNYVASKIVDTRVYNDVGCGFAGEISSQKNASDNYTKEEVENLVYVKYLHGWVKSKRLYNETEARNLPAKIGYNESYKSYNSTYTYVLSEDITSFNGVRLPIVEEKLGNGTIISTRMYSYQLIEPKINQGIIYLSPSGANGAGKADEILGGAYKDVPKNGGQNHHMPADSVSPFSTNKGPVVRMETEDHMQTASWGSSKDAQAYRDAQKQLIDNFQYEEAQQMDIDDIRAKFGDKYDKGIEQMLEYTKKLLELKFK